MKTIALILALCGAVTLPAERPCGLCKGRILQPAKIEVLGIELPGFRFCECRCGREATIYGELLRERR
jgi:hypothetical protein